MENPREQIRKQLGLPSVEKLSEMRSAASGSVQLTASEKAAAAVDRRASEMMATETIAAARKNKTGLRFDAGKRRVYLFPMDAFDGTCDVLTYGATKKHGPGGLPYGERNWEGGLHWIEQCIGPMMRHLSAFMQGEDIDPESGLPHVDHMGCDVAFLQAMFKRRKDLDDRRKEGR